MPQSSRPVEKPSSFVVCCTALTSVGLAAGANGFPNMDELA
eukprot:CAMPEP_0206278406 /NCGR_PEP_ID=MMETSP0047_2-20121206/37402_1 /ASSEMBLY_ACC=CAM_ASM_000192 /TAXON_ID=195065 /ORGANISM="Chroomonas mesostigmatica_cf, Strain CCMP1168" /LENGTH=40 /DNA_ID= /DNA_START= /DNA_END= /DNA_ORIENTATION=